MPNPLVKDTFLKLYSLNHVEKDFESSFPIKFTDLSFFMIVPYINCVFAYLMLAMMRCGQKVVFFDKS